MSASEGKCVGSLVEEIYRINTDYITYTGTVQAIKSCVRKTGLTVESDSTMDLIQMLKITYSRRKRLTPLQ